jgi:hypothetical protein
MHFCLLEKKLFLTVFQLISSFWSKNYVPQRCTAFENWKIPFRNSQLAALECAYPKIWRSLYGDAASPYGDTRDVHRGGKLTAAAPPWTSLEDTASSAGDAASPREDLQISGYVTLFRKQLKSDVFINLFLRKFINKTAFSQ